MVLPKQGHGNTGLNHEYRDLAESADARDLGSRPLGKSSSLLVPTIYRISVEDTQRSSKPLYTGSNPVSCSTNRRLKQKSLGQR